MICKECGARNDRDAVFCKKCGAPLGKNSDAGQKSLPIKGIAAVLVVLLLAGGLFLLDRGTGYGDKSPEALAERYLQACRQGDGEALLSLYPKPLVEQLYQHSGVKKQQVAQFYGYLLSDSSIYQAGEAGQTNLIQQESYDYNSLKRVEQRYRQYGLDFSLDQSIEQIYVLNWVQYGADQQEILRIPMIQEDGRFYLDDSSDQLNPRLFFGRDLGQVAWQLEGLQQRQQMAEYLGCHSFRLFGPIESQVQGREYWVCRYRDDQGFLMDPLFYLDGDQVMAYFSGDSIPVEQLPPAQRDSSWKVKFVIPEPEPDLRVDIVSHLDWQQQEEIAAPQREALLEYLGCNQDELWFCGLQLIQEGEFQPGFWYVQDYEQVSEQFLVLMEDGTAAWCDTSGRSFSESDGEKAFVQGQVKFLPIQRGAFQSEPTDPYSPARNLTWQQQQQQMADYLGCEIDSLRHCQVNEAQRDEFYYWQDGKFDLVFLLEDGTVAMHQQGQPPLRVEGVTPPQPVQDLQAFVDQFLGHYTSTMYTNANLGMLAELSIFKQDNTLVIDYNYLNDPNNSFQVILPAADASIAMETPYQGLKLYRDDNEISFVANLDTGGKMRLKYKPPEETLSGKATIEMMGGYGIDFLDRDDDQLPG